MNKVKVIKINYILKKYIFFLINKYEDSIMDTLKIINKLNDKENFIILW